MRAATPAADRLFRIAAPSQPPVTLSECKDHLRMTGSAEDATIQGMADAAINYVDGLGVLGRAMITQTWRQYFDAGVDVVPLEMTPVQSLVAVGYVDADGAVQAATLSDFEIFGPSRAATLRPKSGFAWPSADNRPGSLWVDYVAGYGDDPHDVPHTVRHAIKMLVAHYDMQRMGASEKAMQEVPFGFSDLIAAERGRWYG